MYELEIFDNPNANWESDESFIEMFERSLEMSEMQKKNEDEYCGPLKESYGWDL